MKVNVAQLKRNPGAQMDIRLEGSPPSLKKDIAPEATLTSPLTVRLNLSNTGTVILLKGPPGTGITTAAVVSGVHTKS